MSVAKRSAALGLVSLLIIAASVWLWLNRQFLQDWQVVQRYTPSAAIMEIAQRADMSDKGRFLFYASQPVISKADEFNQQCNRREVTTAILGCYSGGRIYLYDIDNAQLDGIKEVTAAHEMLHAAWARLSDSEKERLGEHLDAVYERIKTDALEERMAYYERQQPGERHNELHSILATEFSQLDETLEQYYTQHFTNRQTVVALHAKYEAIFTALQRQAEQLRQEIATILTRLNADIATFNTAVTRLEAEITAHNSQSETIDRTDPDEVTAYNTRQASLMARRAQLSREEAALEQRRNEYQQKVQQYNELVIRSETLNDSLDSVKASPDGTE